jgi:hypothetical protein
MHVMQRNILKTLAFSLVATPFFLLWAPESNAQSKYAIAGAGVTSCGQYLKPPKGTKQFSDSLVVTWMQGYLSDTNTQRFASSKIPFKLQPDPESITAFLDKYCRENPLKTLFDAALNLDSSY